MAGGGEYSHVRVRDIVLWVAVVEGFDNMVFMLYQAILVSLAVLSAPLTAIGQTGPSKAPTPLDAAAAFSLAGSSVLRVDSTSIMGDPIKSGTGFFVSDDGLFVTNYHVIQDGFWVSVVHPSGAVFEVEGVRGFLPKDDIVVLKLKTSKVPFIRMGGSATIDVGSKVFAIGNPKGLENTISEGIISGKRELEGDRFLLQTTAPISPGSSGGPLIDDRGRVVGVTTFYLADGQNLNFAVPTAVVQRLLEASTELRPLTDVVKKIELPSDKQEKLKEEDEQSTLSEYMQEKISDAWKRIQADSLPRFRVRVSVACRDAGLTSLIESKLLNALRGLSGVEISDLTPDYEIAIVALPTEGFREAVVGVSASVVVSRVVDGTQIGENRRLLVTQELIQNHSAFQWGRERIGNGVESLVAKFDSEQLEPMRKLQSDIRERRRKAAENK